MNGLWLLIPAKGFAKGKSRLAPILDVGGREAFARACLAHAVRVARRVIPSRRIVIVSRDAKVLGLAQRLGARTMFDAGRGLNEALTAARQLALTQGATAVLVMHADLPAIQGADVRALVHALRRHRGAVIAPDSAGEGSNALGVRPAGKMRFRFGVDSFARHRAEARAQRLRLRVIRGENLGLDIDTPEAYRAWLQRHQ